MEIESKPLVLNIEVSLTWITHPFIISQYCLHQKFMKWTNNISNIEFSATSNLNQVLWTVFNSIEMVFWYRISDELLTRNLFSWKRCDFVCAIKQWLHDVGWLFHCNTMAASSFDELSSLLMNKAYFYAIACCSNQNSKCNSIQSNATDPTEMRV